MYIALRFGAIKELSNENMPIILDEAFAYYDEERLNIVLDMCYGCKNNRQFCWDVVGDLIIRRLEELENNGELYI